MRTSHRQSWFLTIPSAMVGLALTIASVSFAGSSDSGSNSTNKSDAAPGKTLTGKATYYPNKLNGHETASGTKFHQSGHTAASNKLPLGTGVEVTNLKNDRSTHVTVTDRGPALGKRRIDLSKKAAKEIGLTHKQGVAPVEIKVTHPPDNREAPAQK